MRTADSEILPIPHWGEICRLHCADRPMEEGADDVMRRIPGSILRQGHKLESYLFSFFSVKLASRVLSGVISCRGININPRSL